MEESLSDSKDLIIRRETITFPPPPSFPPLYEDIKSFTKSFETPRAPLGTPLQYFLLFKIISFFLNRTVLVIVENALRQASKEGRRTPSHSDTVICPTQFFRFFLLMTLPPSFPTSLKLPV